MKHLKYTILATLSLFLGVIAALLLLCEENDANVASFTLHVIFDKSLGILAGLAAYWIYRQANKAKIQTKQL